MENPEAMLDVLSMETFRQRLALQGNGGQGLNTKQFQFPGDDEQLENIVRDLCIDDSISGCFAEEDCEVKDTSDSKVWLPNPKKNIAPSKNLQKTKINLDKVSHLKSPVTLDGNLFPSQSTAETRRKEAFCESTDGSSNIGIPQNINNKISYKPITSATDMLLDEMPTVKLPNNTNIFSRTPANTVMVDKGSWFQSKLPFGAYPNTANRAELSTRSAVLSQGICRVDNSSSLLEKKRVGIFQGDYIGSIDKDSSLNVSSRSSSSSSPVSTAFSPNRNIDIHPDNAKFQRMTSRNRLDKKRIQYQEQGLKLSNRPHVHSDSYPLQSTKSPCGLQQKEVVSVINRNSVDKKPSNKSILILDQQEDYNEEFDIGNISGGTFNEQDESTIFENGNLLEFGMESPEAYFLPSFPTTSDDFTISRILGPEVSFSDTGFQKEGQAFRRAVVSCHNPDDSIEPIPGKTLEGKKRKGRKPWYDVDDRKMSSGSHPKTTSNVNLRAVIEQSARLISPEPDTSSEDPVDERTYVLNKSEPKLHISGKSVAKSSFSGKNDQNSSIGRSANLKNSSHRGVHFQESNILYHSYSVDEPTTTHAPDHLYANINPVFITTDYTTSVSSRLNLTSTSVSSSAKTLPSVIPIKMDTSSSNGNEISAFALLNTRSDPTIVHSISNVSTVSVPVTKDTITTTSTSSNVDVHVFSSSVQSRSGVTNCAMTSTTKSFPSHTNVVSTALIPNALLTPTSVLSSVNYTEKCMTSLPSISPALSTSNSVISESISEGYQNGGSLQLDADVPATIKTVNNDSSILEFDEQLRACIDKDEQESLRRLTLSDSFVHSSCWYCHQDKAFTPYHLAIQLGRLECLRILLESQPLLERCGWGEGLGLDLAKMAVRSNQVQCLLLLHNLMDVSLMKGSMDEEGNTLMHLAASLNHTDITVALLSLGHDVNAENIAGISPLKLCLQHSALSKQVASDHTQTIDLKQSPVKKSDHEFIAIASDSMKDLYHDKVEDDTISGEFTSRFQNDLLNSFNLIPVHKSEHTDADDQGHAEISVLLKAESTVDLDKGKQWNDAIDIQSPNDIHENSDSHNASLQRNEDFKILENAQDQNGVMNLILTELIRCTSKPSQINQSSDEKATPAISQVDLVRSLLDGCMKQQGVGKKEVGEKEHNTLKGDNCANIESVNFAGELNQGSSVGFNTEDLFRKYVHEYVKSLQVKQNSQEKENMSRGNKLKTKKSPAKRREAAPKENRCRADSDFITAMKDIDILASGGTDALNGNNLSAQQNPHNSHREQGDRKSDISSPDSKDKEIDSFCISSDELYNSPPDRIPTLPIKSRSSRQPHNIRVRPGESLNAINVDYSREGKLQVKTHERDKAHPRLNTGRDFRNQKRKSDISFILDSSSTSQDLSEDRQKDYLHDDSAETARRREARRRRWGGLSLLPHHLKKKIERLSQKGKRKTACGGISGSSNSSSSIVTSSSSSGGGIGDQSVEGGGSSVRAIVDFQDNRGRDYRHYSDRLEAEVLEATANQHAPMHVKPTGSCDNSSSALTWTRVHDYHDIGNSANASTEGTNHRSAKEQHGHSRDSDQFWMSADTFSSLTALSEDNEVDLINSISDVSLDKGQDSVSGFYNMRHSRSHRRHHHHHGHHHHHHHQRSRSSDQSERDRYYHNHRCHHRRRRREALGCSPSRRRHRGSDKSADDNADIDEGDTDTDEEGETDASDDPRVKVNVDNEEWPDEMLRVQRLAKHLESVHRLQTGNCQVIETVITGTGEVLTSQEDGFRDPNHVNIGEAYPFSSNDPKAKRAPLRTRRTTSPSGLVGKRAKINLFNHEKLSSTEDAKSGPKEAVTSVGNLVMTAVEKCREMDKDVPWDLLTFSDSDDTDFGELNSR